jgi:CheY-like chemotaxis protein
MGAPPPPLKLPNLAGLTLLVVDDDPDSVEILAIFLKACGASVLAALTVSGALLYVTEARKLDAVVTDIAMPGMDGVELARKLRADPMRNRLPIIAVTGFYEDYLNREQFDAFLKKPVDLDKLASTIASLAPR